MLAHRAVLAWFAAWALAMHTISLPMRALDQEDKWEQFVIWRCAHDFGYQTHHLATANFARCA